jgi:hypothetical protein
VEYSLGVLEVGEDPSALGIAESFSNAMEGTLNRDAKALPDEPVQAVVGDRVACPHRRDAQQQQQNARENPYVPRSVRNYSASQAIVLSKVVGGSG